MRSSTRTRSPWQPAREAAARDQFDPGNLRPKVAITVARLPAARDKAFSENGATLHLVVRGAYDPSVENATSGSDSPSPSVVVRNAIFSKSNNAPRNDEERQKQEVVNACIHGNEVLVTWRKSHSARRDHPRHAVIYRCKRSPH